MLKKLFISLFLLISLGANAKTMSYGEFSKKKNSQVPIERAMIVPYFSGMVIGITMTQAFSTKMGNQPIYCPPPQKAQDYNFAQETIDQYLAINNLTLDDVKDISLDVVYILSLTSVYPCNSSEE